MLSLHGHLLPGLATGTGDGRARGTRLFLLLIAFLFLQVPMATEVHTPPTQVSRLSLVTTPAHTPWDSATVQVLGPGASFS